jgi:hypothetical protein
VNVDRFVTYAAEVLESSGHVAAGKAYRRDGRSILPVKDGFAWIQLGTGTPVAFRFIGVTSEILDELIPIGSFECQND